MIAANRGATAGWLVPLSVGLCYIGKPGTFVPSSSIAKVLFHRTGAGSSTFDVTIKLAPGAADAAAAAAKPLELGQIDAAELNKLQGYLLAQRIRVSGSQEGVLDVGLGTSGDGVWTQRANMELTQAGVGAF